MVTVDCNDFMKFMKGSHKVFLPEDSAERRKVIDRNFRDSCMVVQTRKGDYFVGKLSHTNFAGYSMNVNGKEMQFSYPDTKAIFKPQLC
jgi:hypothetical protein